LRSIEEHRQTIESRGVRLVAISVDPPATTREHIKKQGYNFLFLSDEKREVLRQWDLVHPGAFRGEDIARPAEFLLDPEGIVRWVHLTDRYQVRPKGEQLLEAMDQAGVPAAAEKGSGSAAGIERYLRVSERFSTGAQPTLEQLALLRDQGVRTVINLRRPSEHDAAAEAKKVGALGMRYVSIPVDPAAPADDQVAEFLRATADEAGQPAFLHCSSANRVGAFWMIRRVVVDGWTVEKAEEEARRIGLRTAVMREFALDYIQRQKKN
jgi:uncharacterized protein (TIGR01244 family)